jgi:hypothetical protein
VKYERNNGHEKVMNGCSFAVMYKYMDTYKSTQNKKNCSRELGLNISTTLRCGKLGSYETVKLVN